MREFTEALRKPGTYQTTEPATFSQRMLIADLSDQLGEHATNVHTLTKHEASQRINELKDRITIIKNNRYQGDE